MPVWPFKSREVFTESLAWRTDIIRAKGSEQRFALRRDPRRVFDIQHTLTAPEYTAARALVRQDEQFQVPDWPLAIDAGAVAPGASVPIAIDEPDINLSAGDSAVLWQSSSQYELVMIDSVDSAGVVLTAVLGTYTRATFVPAYTANAPEGLRGARPAGAYMSGDIEFLITYARAVEESSYATYRGHDLVDDCPVVASQSFNEPINWPYESVDNELGVARFFNTRNIPDPVYMMRWHVFTRTALYELRKFLNSRRGRWKAFWLSSFGRDFELAAGISSVATTVQVFAPAGVIDLGRDSFDINIHTAAGDYYRQVLSYLPGSDVDGKPTLVLTIDSALGDNLQVDDVERVSYLRCLRFNADRIELEHKAASGVSVAVPVLEILP